jgi:hypothetical protein
MLPISSLIIDQDVQMRERTRDEVVEDYREKMQDGFEFPPVDVFEDDAGQRILADGFHRVAAAMRAGRKDILAILKPGGREGAIKWAMSANATHGLPRSNADKRKAGFAAIKLYHPALSAHEISKKIGVSQVFISKLIKELKPAVAPEQAKGEEHPPTKPDPVEPKSGDRSRSPTRTVKARQPKGDGDSRSRDPAFVQRVSKLPTIQTLLMIMAKLPYTGAVGAAVEERLLNIYRVLDSAAVEEHRIMRSEDEATSYELVLRLLIALSNQVETDESMAEVRKDIRNLIGEVRSKGRAKSPAAANA